MLLRITYIAERNRYIVQERSLFFLWTNAGGINYKLDSPFRTEYREEDLHILYEDLEKFKEKQRLKKQKNKVIAQIKL